MPTYDQLEIIGPNGEIEFCSLDPDKGVTNIGQHPENDIVLDDPRVAPFQAMLDHRQKPYQLIVLSQEGETTLAGEPLSPNVVANLQNWDNIELGGHTLILIEDGGTSTGQVPVPATVTPERPVTTPLPPPPSTSAAPYETPPSLPSPPPTPPSPLPARPAILPLPTTRPEAPTGVYPTPPPPAPPPQPGLIPEPGISPPAPGPAGFFTTRPPDQEDEAIVIELSENEWLIDVEQTATCQLTITNGGNIVAAFAVSIQGLEESWVTVSQPYVNLYEGERATITLSITPPRLPGSQAGAHHFAVIVTSTNYPGRMSQRGATLTINPYYEFAVGELSPRRQSISWSKHFGRATLPITNLGNSDAPFRLEGTDEEKACSFEFDVPGEAVSLATQAELRLQPEETTSIPVRITPYSRRLIAFRKRTHAYTVTTSPLAGQQTPRSMLGELKSAPLIGPLWFLLMALILTIVILILARPRLNTFMFTDGGQAKVISNGTPVAIRWEASIFTTDRNIETDNDVAIEALEQPVPRRGTVVDYPKTDTTYTLVGGNILSRFASALFPPPIKTIEVEVNAISPVVTFEARPSQVVSDEEVTLSWQVQYANKIELFRRVGDSGPLELINDLSEQPTGSLQVTPEPDQSTTFYLLKASNDYAPTPTPIPRRVSLLTPTPSILRFEANPSTINEGEKSTLSWLVQGVQQITLQDPGGGQSAQAPDASLMVAPTASGKYTLLAGGAQPRDVQIYVTPATPTPTSTPEPTAPDITFFTADPDEIVKGDDTLVELKWTIVGTTTNVELSSPELANPLSNLQNQGSFKITLDDTALFVLTAFNDTAKDNASAQIETVDPTPTPTSPPPTPVLPTIIEFKIAAKNHQDHLASFTLDSETSIDSNSKQSNYSVTYGSQIQLEWRIQNAKDALLNGDDVSATIGVEKGTSYLNDVDGSNVFELRAANEAGAEARHIINIQAIPQDPPPAPTNFENTGIAPNSFTWDYPSGYYIKGYKVYRNGVVVWSTTNPNEKTWTDSVPGPHCGEIYFVVAIYYDYLSQTDQETNASAHSWSAPSPPCP